jgi:SAM-dependent methyltransferase
VGRLALAVGPPLRQFVKRSKWALIGYTIAHSWNIRRRFALGGIESVSGSTHAALPVSDSVAYINRTYDDYLRYGRLSSDLLQGKSVLEGGPGDNLGVALRFVAAGAALVVAMDKFYSRQDSQQQRQIYLALRAHLSQDEKRRYDRAVDLSSSVVFNEELVKTMYGKGMEECGDLVDQYAFDMIISRVVLEMIYDTDRVFAGMHKLLRPGGIMLHKIDLRDYGLFSSNGHHPLEFLAIPDAVYEWMVRDSDRPSRKAVDYYRNTMTTYGYDAELYITSVISAGYRKPPTEVLPHKTVLEHGVDYTDETLDLIRSIRPRLARPFRQMSETDLMVAGVFLVARKP